jgi:hypothetical protein
MALLAFVAFMALLALYGICLPGLSGQSAWERKIRTYGDWR